PPPRRRCAPGQTDPVSASQPPTVPACPVLRDRSATDRPLEVATPTVEDPHSMSMKVALITGASRGLGLEVARAYARRGLRLIITARGAEPLKQAADELAALTDVVALAGDVADPEHDERVVRAGLDKFQHIDVLVNNASELGPSPMPELQNLSREAFEDILRVNVVAPLKLTQLVLPGMRAGRNGLIVNVTSDAGVQAYPTWGGYGRRKAA